MFRRGWGWGSCGLNYRISAKAPNAPNSFLMRKTHVEGGMVFLQLVFHWDHLTADT